MCVCVAARDSGERRFPSPREERLVAGGLSLRALEPAGGGRGVRHHRLSLVGCTTPTCSRRAALSRSVRGTRVRGRRRARRGGCYECEMRNAKMRCARRVMPDRTV